MIALYIGLCLWSHRPEVCNDIPLTPGAAGKPYATVEACRRDQWRAINAWWHEAGPVFGIRDFAGPGYRIRSMYCGPAPKNQEEL